MSDLPYVVGSGHPFGPLEIDEEVRVRVERRSGGDLPDAGMDVLGAALHELGEPNNELRMTLDLAKSDLGLNLVAFDDGHHVGMLLAATEPRTRSAFIRWVVVDPRARRNGMATALLDALAATPGLDGLTGMVDQEDPTALGFWQDRGWTVRRPRPGRRRQLMSVDLAAGRSEAA